MKLFARIHFAGRFALVFAVLVAALALQAESLQPSNVAIDFSTAGYGAAAPLPQVQAALRVQPTGADDTLLLQQALNALATRPLNAQGFRGALVLAAGRYHVQGQLVLRASGVVLRGAGVGKTIVVAEGNSRRALICAGADRAPQIAAPINVISDAAAGSRELHLASISGLKVGAAIVITRPSTAEWVATIGMTNLPGKFANILQDWKPGSRNLLWDRTIAAIDPARNTITLDAPITMALEQRWGAGTVALVTGNQPVERIGIEDLSLESAHDAVNPLDEEHAWIAIQMDNLRDGWVRNVVTRHFVSSAVRVNNRARRITVLDCQSLAPIAERAGYRRQSFVANGQQVLIARCLGEEGMNDFATGMLAAGPNVFLRCTARNALGASGSFESLAAGILYEQVSVPDSRLQLMLDLSRAQGAGWTSVNSFVWNSSAKIVDVLGAPGSPNRTVESATPLFATQLAARTGLTLEALFAEPTSNLADTAAPLFHATAQPAAAPAPQPSFEIVGGRFVIDGRVGWGESDTEAWWKGDISPLTAAAASGSSITRFMPGVTGPGETEDLAALARHLKQLGAVSIQVNPGLWYERRRDSHTMERRNTADVWAPFFESPWARSGQGTAWDGLSRYDLTRFNPWYFARHRAFAAEAAQQGIVVFYDLYNTHNVLELGPHWMDFPWRPANNINNTGLPEPPPLRYEDRNDVGNEFFSAATPQLRELHRAYILHTLDELADQPNLIFGLAYQYAGPLSFQQFFLDTIAEWEQAHHKRVRIALTTSKASTDAILADPERRKLVSVVDMRYWEPLPDGSLWAPEAGINRAFREQIMAQFPGLMDLPPETTEQLAYRAIRDYHARYPELALMPMVNGGGILPVLMAGAAAPSALRNHPPAAIMDISAKLDCSPTTDAIPRDCAPPSLDRVQADDAVVASFVCQHLATKLMKMEPQDNWTASPESTWTLAASDASTILIDSLSGTQVELHHAVAVHRALWLNPRSGAEREAKAQSGVSNPTFTKPDSTEWLLFIE
jgi:hypothetical protein